MNKLQEIESFALRKIKELCPEGWKLAFDRKSVRLGCCNYTDKTITLSVRWVEKVPIEHSKDTVLHEIAHVLTPGHGHDLYFERKCKELGCKPFANYMADDYVRK